MRAMRREAGLPTAEAAGSGHTGAQMTHMALTSACPTGPALPACVVAGCETRGGHAFCTPGSAGSSGVTNGRISIRAGCFVPCA